MEQTKTKHSFLHQFIGDKAFYKMVLAIAVPIMVQNGITNFVSLLDNIMIGQVGTEQMSGVAIVNQLLFVYNLCLFGAVSGAGIFTAQYFGQKNHEGIRQTVRFKLLTVLVITVITIALFLGAGDTLIHLYLQGGRNDRKCHGNLNLRQRVFMDYAAGTTTFYDGSGLCQYVT